MLALMYGKDTAGKKFTDLLLAFSFDELFEIDPEADSVRCLYHTQNKYALPLQSDKFSTICNFSGDHLVHPMHHGQHKDFMTPDSWAAAAAASPIPGMLTAVFRVRLMTGQYHWVRYLLLNGEENGVPAGKWYLYFLDTHIQAEQNGISVTPGHIDTVTGLANSSHFFQRAALMSGEGRELCCLALDIDHFSLFNSVYGIEKGDSLLGAFGETLRKGLEGHFGLAGYFGHDDFVVLAEYDPVWISNLYKSLRSAIFEHSRVFGFCPVIGVYHLPKDTAPDLEMYDKALTALQEAKLKHGERIAEFSILFQQSEMDEFQVLRDIQEAIADDRLEFHLQPQCHISNRRIVGAEALVRMRSEDGTLVPPGKFIPILERNGCIAEVDKRVWRMVCQWLRSLLDRDILPVPISINVSQMDILTMDVAGYLASLVEEFRIPPHLLKVEITESFYAEKAETVQDIVKSLAQHGFTTMMDDFGSGYSSLNMLENLTVDVLKLDMDFMRTNKFRTRRGVTIIESIINMAKMIGMPIIVEGVETAQQVQFLQSLGCRYAQGYHFHRPMPCQEFEALLTSPEMIEKRGIVGKSNEQYHVREFLDDNTFTDSMLNNILGPVAFYAFDGKHLTITRFNQQFYHAISDVQMETRQQAIEQYVVPEDRPALFNALNEAIRNPAVGGNCEIRFYKSNGSVFWYHMHLFYLKTEEQKDIFYGQIEDVTEWREQGMQFFEVLLKQSKLCMCINLDNETIQYAESGEHLMQNNLPSMDLSESAALTAAQHIPNEADRVKFLNFFHAERLRSSRRQGIYHENLVVTFRMYGCEPKSTVFSTYYIRYGSSQDLNVYVFVQDPTGE